MRCIVAVCRERGFDMSTERGDSLARLVNVLAEWGPMSAGQVGYALWAGPAMVCKCENAQATMYCRPAGRLLHRAWRLGLVRYEDRDRRRVWMLRGCNARGGAE